MTRMSEVERFWSKVEKTDTCWLWTGPISKKGYAVFHLWRSGHSATTGHRYAYESVNGPVPKGLELDHLCRVRHCINPAHLEAVTHAENVRRGTLVKHASGICANGHDLGAVGEYAASATGHRRCMECAREARRRYYDRHLKVGVAHKARLS